MCANFGDPRSRDRKLEHKKNRKKRQLFGRKFINFAYNSKTNWLAKLKLGPNMGIMEA